MFYNGDRYIFTIVVPAGHSRYLVNQSFFPSVQSASWRSLKSATMNEYFSNTMRLGQSARKKKK